MSILALVFLAVAAGWFSRSKTVLIAPVLAVGISGLMVFIGRAGTDTPVVTLAIVAEVCLAGGMFARNWTSAVAH